MMAAINVNANTICSINNSSLAKLSFSSVRFQLSSTVSDFNKLDTMLPLAYQLSDNANHNSSSTNNIDSFPLKCSTTQSAFKFFIGGGVFENVAQIYSGIYSPKPDVGSLYVYKLNEYIGVAATAITSKHGSTFSSDCHLSTTSQTQSCPRMNNSKGANIQKVRFYLIKLKNLPANSSGFQIKKSEGVRPGLTSLDVSYPAVEGSININYDIDIKKNISTPLISFNEKTLYFSGSVGENIIKTTSFNIVNSNPSQLDPNLYNLKITTPSRLNSQVGLIGSSQFNVSSGTSGSLPLNGTVSTLSWWPSIAANSTSTVPLTLSFNLLGPGGEHSTILSLEASIP